MSAADVLEFAEIAELISLSRSTTIQPVAKRESPGLWSLHDGIHRVHTSEYPFEVLYLYARAKKEDVEHADREAFREGETHVVYAVSLDQRHRRHRQLFETRAKGLWTTRDYLASFLRGELGTYIQELKALAPRFYINPQFETPAGVTRRTPNPMLEFLRDDDIGMAQAASLVAVVLAEPGQGKTYQSQYLASTLAAFSVVPIYIDSKQWSTMAVDDLRNVYKTVAHSFRSFHSPIAWLEGREEQFLQTTLKANLFKIVFDGFDEYILWNQGRVNATDALQALVDLATETQSRIVLTSRTSFWHGHVEVSDESDSGKKYLLYRLKPFEQQQARNYFEIRFSKDHRVDRATQIYSELAKSNDEFLGRGFVLSLVADLVEDEDVPLPPLTGRSGLNWILEALCEREATRQKLPLTGAEQMEAFRLFALDVAAGTDPSTLALQVALSTANGTLSESALQATIESLATHPIIRPTDGDRWDWTVRQIGLVLLANTLLKIATDQDGVADKGNLAWLHRFGRSGRASDEELDSLAATAVDLARARLPESQQDSILASLVRKLRHSGGSPTTYSSASMRLAFELVSRALERQEWRGRTLEERREFFLSLLGDAEVHDWQFHGTISRMDLRGVTFDGCRFEQVYWSKVKFDSDTEFRNCAFLGGGAVQCEGFGLTRIAGGTRDREATVFIRREQVVAGKKNYSADDLKADLRSALMKFVFASASGFRTIKKSSIRTGTLAHSRHRDEIIGELERLILESIHISGLAEGGFAVRKDAEDALRFYVQNNVVTGPLKEVFERLRTTLKVGT